MGYWTDYGYVSDWSDWSEPVWAQWSPQDIQRDALTAGDHLHTNEGGLPTYSGGDIGGTVGSYAGDWWADNLWPGTGFLGGIVGEGAGRTAGELLLGNSIPAPSIQYDWQNNGWNPAPTINSWPDAWVNPVAPMFDYDFVDMNMSQYNWGHDWGGSGMGWNIFA